MNYIYQLIINSKLFQKALKTPISRWCVLLADMLIVMFCWMLLTFADVIKFSEPVIGPQKMIAQIVAVVVVFFVMNFITKCYQCILRLSMLSDLIMVSRMVFYSGVTLMLVSIIVYYTWEHCLFSMWDIVFLCMVSLVLLWMLRMVIKFAFLKLSYPKDSRTPVIVLGSSLDSGIVANALAAETTGKYRPVAFLSINGQNTKFKSNGMPVELFDESTVADVFKKYDCHILVFLPSHKQLLQDGFASNLLSLKISLLMVNQTEEFDLSSLQQSPDSSDKKDTRISSHIKNVQIEDLLGREVIKIDNQNVKSYIHNRCVMVTGAAGSIGSEIVRQVAAYGAHCIVLLDQAETPMHYMQLEMQEKFPDTKIVLYVADVKNVKRLDYAFATYKPSIVYHAAAYKHVPMMEINPTEAVLTNVKGTRILADLAVKYNVNKFVMISTDKAVNPTNIMGATKRIAEIYVQSLFMHNRDHIDRADQTQFITTRFGNVLGSNGSVIPRFRQQIENGGPVTVTHKDIIRYFMTIPEACSLVLEAGYMGHGGEIYIFDMGKPVKIYDLALRMITLAGLRPYQDIQIVETGLRPGEKLYEELLNDKERTIASGNDKIMIAKVMQYDYKDVRTAFSLMIDAAASNNVHEMVRLMKQLVPEYKSQNSPFEAIDRELEQEQAQTSATPAQSGK